MDPPNHCDFLHFSLKLDIHAAGMLSPTPAATPGSSACVSCCLLFDAAMLTVDDPAFWKGVEPVKFGVLPRLQDSVTVIGYVTFALSMLYGNAAAFTVRPTMLDRG